MVKIADFPIIFTTDCLKKLQFLNFTVGYFEAFCRHGSAHSLNMRLILAICGAQIRSLSALLSEAKWLFIEFISFRTLIF